MTKIDDTFYWILKRANQAAQLFDQGYCQEDLVDMWAGHLQVQIEKLNATKQGLTLISMPQA